MPRPVFYMALAVLMGSVAGRVMALPLWLDWALLVGFLTAALFLTTRGGSSSSSSNHFLVRRLLLAALFCIALLQQNALVGQQWRGEAQVRQLAALDSTIAIRGTVADEPVVSSSGARIILRDVEFTPSGAQADRSDGSVGERFPVPARVSDSRRLASRIQVNLSRENLRRLPQPLVVRGQRIECLGRMEPLPPGDLPDMFDYGAYLRNKQIAGLFSITPSEDVRGGVGESIRRAPSEDCRLESLLFRSLMSWRRSVLRMLGDALPPQHAGIMQAMLFGDMSSLPQDTRDIFTRIGGSHLFSVSGLHTMFLVFFIFFGCRLLQIPPRATAWITTILLCFYCALIGFLAPVVRASIMAFCLMIPIIARRAVDSLNALSIAVFLTVLFNPAAPFSPDFQFSYLCILGLITLVPSMNEVFCIRPRDHWSHNTRQWAARYNHWIGQGLSVSFAAQLAVLPLLANYYHQVSLIALVANLVMIPFTSFFLLVAGWVLALLGPLHPAAASGLGFLTSIFSVVFLRLADIFASVPGAAILLPSFPWWLVAAYYAVLFSGPQMLMRRAPGQFETRRARMLLRLAAIAALVIWWPLLGQNRLLPGSSPGEFRVTMLDVGQGDSFLLRFPDGQSLLVDAAQKPMARRIQQYLNANGISRLSGLLLTHGDSDHIGGASQIIDSMPVGEVFEVPSSAGSRTEEQLNAAIARDRVPVQSVTQGDLLMGANGMRLEILYPLAPRERQAKARTPKPRMGQAESGTPKPLYSGRLGPGGKYNNNERSVVLLAEYGEMTFLFTGDADARSESALLAQYGPKYLNAEVLKVGHHGSATGTTQPFLDAVRPKVALLSVGARNSYGHPAPALIERLTRSGCSVLATPSRGTVELSTDGHRLWIRSARH